MIFANIFAILLLILITIVPINIGMIISYLKHKDDEILRSKIRTLSNITQLLFIAWVLSPVFAVYTKDPLTEYTLLACVIQELIKNYGIYGAYGAIIFMFWELIRLRSTIDKDFEQVRRELEKSEKYINTRIDDLKNDLQIIKNHLIGPKNKNNGLQNR